MASCGAAPASSATSSRSTPASGPGAASCRAALTERALRHTAPRPYVPGQPHAGLRPRLRRPF
eukprot:9381215-Alexandrium_andersonii.AAC.1